MKKLIMILSVAATLTACKQANQPNKDLAKLFDNYYENKLKLYPLEATSIGDNSHNDQLQNDGSAAFKKQAHDFFASYLDSLKTYKRDDLNEEDKLSYDIFFYIMNTVLEGMGKHIYYDFVNFAHPGETPFNQMVATPLFLGQWGSGTGAQPFKTV